MTTSSVSSSTPSTAGTTTSTIAANPSSTTANTTGTSSATTTSGSGNASSTSANSATAANQAAAQQLINALGAGSGVDVNALAQSLVNAEIVPQQNEINAKINQNDARVSGYSAISYVLSEVQSALTSLKDESSFNTLSVANSSPNAFSATADSTATVGSHSVDVLSLATAQRLISDGFASATTSLNGGNAMNFTLTVGTGSSATTSTISVAAQQDTPQGVVNAINAANDGLSAELANTGDATNPYKIILTGTTGTANQFTLTPQYSMGGVQAHDASMNNGNPINLQITLPSGQVSNLTVTTDTPDGVIQAINGANLGLNAQLVANSPGSTYANTIVVTGPSGSSNFSIAADYTGSGTYQTLTAPTALSFTTNQSAGDAQMNVDGVTYTRPSNTVTDVVQGVTFNLTGVTTTTDATGNTVNNTATVGLTRDTSAITTNINALVSAYNDAVTMFSAVSDPNSTLPTYGATLVGDSTVRMLQEQLTNMLMNPSSTPGSTVGALWQMGVSIDQNGVMSVDSTQLNTALTNNFSDVVKTFTGDQNGLTIYDTTPGGIAGDGVTALTNILSNTGVLATQTQDIQQQNTNYQTDLTNLQTRMSDLLTRYQQQFAAMNTLVGTINSEKTSLTNSFEGMMAMYTNK